MVVVIDVTFLFVYRVVCEDTPLRLVSDEELIAEVIKHPSHYHRNHRYQPHFFCFRFDIIFLLTHITLFYRYNYQIWRRKIDIRHNITDAVVKETYELNEPIGEGASGAVLKVTHKTSGEKFACKIIKKGLLLLCGWLECMYDMHP